MLSDTAAVKTQTEVPEIKADHETDCIDYEFIFDV